MALKEIKVKRKAAKFFGGDMLEVTNIRNGY